MSEQEQIQQLKEEVQKWKARTLAACELACYHCELFFQCEKCKVKRFREEAEK